MPARRASMVGDGVDEIAGANATLEQARMAM
jgi:hypothetical protein